MVFRQTLKVRKNYILDFCSERYIYINIVCVCVYKYLFIYLNMLSFLLNEGKGIGTFRS